MTKVKIRNLEPKDIKRVIRLLKKSGQYHGPWDKVENYRKKRKNDADLMIVAEEKDKIIGFVLGQYDGYGSLMWRLAVAGNKQREGVGTALVREMEKRLRKRGARNIYVLIAQKNKKSQKFFKKLGYYLDTKCWTAGKFV